MYDAVETRPDTSITRGSGVIPGDSAPEHATDSVVSAVRVARGGGAPRGRGFLVSGTGRGTVTTLLIDHKSRNAGPRRAGVQTEHRVYVGDARDLDLPADSVDLVVTSPPYPMVEM